VIEEATSLIGIILAVKLFYGTYLWLLSVFRTASWSLSDEHFQIIALLKEAKKPHHCMKQYQGNVLMIMQIPAYAIPLSILDDRDTSLLSI